MDLTDHTFNPWWGCERVSPACAHCYADTFAKRVGESDLWQAGGRRRPASEGYWQKPLRWNRDAEAAGTPLKVFCASMADAFEDHPALPPLRDRLFDVIEQTPSLRWQLLTKRPHNVMRMVPWEDGLPPNVWIGTSIENARHAWRATVLRQIPAVIRFLSCEPLLGSLFTEQPAEPTAWTHPTEGPVMGYYQTCPECGGRHRTGGWDLCPQCGLDLVDIAPLDLEGIGWVIAGGESGPGHRPMKLEWARELRDACEFGPAFFFKQVGGATPKAGGKALDGREWCDFPSEYAVI